MRTRNNVGRRRCAEGRDVDVDCVLDRSECALRAGLCHTECRLAALCPNTRDGVVVILALLVLIILHLLPIPLSSFHVMSSSSSTSASCRIVIVSSSLETAKQVAHRMSLVPVAHRHLHSLNTY